MEAGARYAGVFEERGEFSPAFLYMDGQELFPDESLLPSLPVLHTRLYLFVLNEI